MTNGMPAIFDGIEQAMRHLSHRQRVIAQNIANSETPGYRANEVEAPDFGSLVSVVSGGRAGGGAPRVGRPQIGLTSGMAALGASQPLRGAGVVKDQDITETKPNGNNVTLEDQLLRMGQVQQDFTALTSLYRKQMNLLRIAIGRGGGGA